MQCVTDDGFLADHRNKYLVINCLDPESCIRKEKLRWSDVYNVGNYVIETGDHSLFSVLFLLTYRVSHFL